MSTASPLIFRRQQFQDDNELLAYLVPVRQNIFINKIN
ncbi:hypothetical protein (plasmid) [Salmonella enterica subsp. enterica serovar Enteritidis]|nr:hypothetical protein [Salmonella enterica subsp. enterica serovar Enteritidis]